jgi:Zn-dependent protease
MEIPVIILVLLFSVVIHECAHGYVAERYGDHTARLAGRLTLNPVPHIDPVGTILVPLILALLPGNLLLGWAKPVPVNAANLRDPVRDHPKVALAGPLSNLALATLSALALGVLVGLAGLPPDRDEGMALLPAVHTFFFLLLQYGVLYNVLLALFNLIPLPPLDGSWVVMPFLPRPLRPAYARLRHFGFLLLVLILSTDLWHVLARGVGTVSQVFFTISDWIVKALA